MVDINSNIKFFLNNQPKGYIPKHNQNILDFSGLVNVLGFSLKITKIIEKISLNILNQYGDRSGSSLKSKISRWLKIPVSFISLGNGSDELIELISRTFINPGEIIISQTPTFFRVIEASLRAGAKIKLVKAENDFTLSNQFTEKMIDEIKKSQPKLIWLCTPCNPTGETVALDHISKIASIARELVIVDEVYQEILDPENKKSAINLLSEHENIIILKSFSKAFGLAGIRIGFVIGNPKIIDIFEKTRLNFNISTLSQKIAESALDDLGFLKKSHKFFKKEREWLFAEIRKLSSLVIGGNSKINVFILKHKTKNIFQELLNHKILTADFNQANGLENQGFVRITIKTRQENEILLRALKKIN